MATPGNTSDYRQLAQNHINHCLQYSDALAESDIPKLFLRARPGALLSESAADAELLQWVRNLPNQTEVTVFGTHYVQETSPYAIGRAIADWMNSAAYLG